MNKLILIMIRGCLASMMLGGCGQPGPLYLPKDQPSVYSEPKPVAGPETAKQEVSPDGSAPPKN